MFFCVTSKIQKLRDLDVQNLFLYLGLLLSCYDGYSAIHTAHLSSAWYPQVRTELEKILEKFDQQAAFHSNYQIVSGKVKALILPHAGYQYSGHIAAAGYHTIADQKVTRVIILAPSHFVSFHGVALPSFTQYQTPLGNCACDVDCLTLLKKERLFHFYDAAFKPEHSLEVQIPFIQKYMPQAKIVPLVVGDITRDNAHEIAQVLQSCIDDTTVVVVSSDFTHYGRRFGYVPFTESITAKIFALDASLVRTIQNQNFHDFHQLCHETGATVCGRNPLSIFLSLAEKKAFGAVEPLLLSYDTSAAGQANPDYSVSYVSLVFQETCEDHYSLFLTPYEKEQLLKIARHTVNGIFEKNQELPKVVSKNLMDCYGVFVSLYTMTDHGKKLRGCVGRVESDKPLYELVEEMTISAALHDFRFNPLQAREAELVILSISVLNKPKKVSSYKDIVLGRDGVILKFENASAVYLPKVAIEQKWDCQTMLYNLSQKAGLSVDAWKDKKAELWTFQTIEFQER